MNPATLGKAIFVTVVCDIMLPAVLAITHTLTTYYIFFRSGNERVKL